jgi:hypothetical protein
VSTWAVLVEVYVSGFAAGCSLPFACPKQKIQALMDPTPLLNHQPTMDAVNLLFIMEATLPA